MIADRHDQFMDELAGLFIPLITPFTAAGDIAASALERLARRVLDDGAAGIVALGTTAEAASLTEPEKTQVLDICSRVCRERAVPLIAGAGTNDTARSAAELGFEVGGEATGGSADSGFTAALGTPTLCGTGPVGGNAHTDDEWCRIDTMVPRAQALALTILAMAAA